MSIKKTLKGPSKTVKRAYLVESDFGKDVFESAKGAARFIIHNLGGSYIYHINFGRQRDREFIRNVHKKIHNSTDSGSAVAIGAHTVRDPQFLGLLAKEIRTKDEVSIQSGTDVPVNTLTWKGEVKIEERSVSFRVSPVDYFKGRQFPSYVDEARVRQNLKEDGQLFEEEEDRRLYLRVTREGREGLLGDSTTIDRDKLAKMTDDEIDELWIEMEMDEHLAELERE